LHQLYQWQIQVEPLHAKTSPVLDLVVSAAIADQPCNSTPFVCQIPQLGLFHGNRKSSWALKCQARVRSSQKRCRKCINSVA